MQKELGRNILKFFFFAVCTIGIIIVSVWSYYQTQEFFSPFDYLSGFGNGVVSNGLSLIAQYGQNVALFITMIEAGRRVAYGNKLDKLRGSGNKSHIAILEEEIRKSKNTTLFFWILFGVFAFVDAGTNVGEFNRTVAVNAAITFTGLTLTLFTIFGNTIVVAIVFVEELFMYSLDSTLHAFNDLLESLGKKRIAAFDLFVDPDKVIATKMEEKGGKNFKDEAPSRPSTSYPPTLPKASPAPMRQPMPHPQMASQKPSNPPFPMPTSHPQPIKPKDFFESLDEDDD